MHNDFRWEDSSSLQHHCGFCERPLLHPVVRKSCLGDHSEPCARFHQALFMRNRSHQCMACHNMDECHRKRHAEIAEQLREIYRLCGRDSLVLPESGEEGRSAGTAGDEDSRCGSEDVEDVKITKKERKAAKELARAKGRAKVITGKEIDYIDEVLHLHRDEPNALCPSNPHEIEEIEKNIRYHAHVYAHNTRPSLLRSFAKITETDIDFGAEMYRILEVFDINDLVRRNSRHSSPQVKELRYTLKKLDHFKKLVVEDLVIVKKEDLEIRMRRAAFLRFANWASYDIITKRHEVIDWKTGERIIRTTPKDDLREEHKSGTDDDENCESICLPKEDMQPAEGRLVCKGAFSEPVPGISKTSIGIQPGVPDLRHLQTNAIAVHGDKMTDSFLQENAIASTMLNAQAEDKPISTTIQAEARASLGTVDAPELDIMLRGDSANVAADSSDTAPSCPLEDIISTSTLLREYGNHDLSPSPGSELPALLAADTMISLSQVDQDVMFQNSSPASKFAGSLNLEMPRKKAPAFPFLPARSPTKSTRKKSFGKSDVLPVSPPPIRSKLERKRKREIARKVPKGAVTKHTTADRTPEATRLKGPELIQFAQEAMLEAPQDAIPESSPAQSTHDRSYETSSPDDNEAEMPTLEDEDAMSGSFSAYESSGASTPLFVPEGRPGPTPLELLRELQKARIRISNYEFSHCHISQPNSKDTPSYLRPPPRHDDWLKFEERHLHVDCLSNPTKSTADCPYLSAGLIDCPFHVPASLHSPRRDTVMLVCPSIFAFTCGPFNRLRGEKLIILFDRFSELRGRLMLVDNCLYQFLMKDDPREPPRLIRERASYLAGYPPGRWMKQEMEFNTLEIANSATKRQWTHEELVDMHKQIEPPDMDTICYCHGPVPPEDECDEAVIECSHLGCKTAKFHRVCVRKWFPEMLSKWYCPECAECMEVTARKCAKELGLEVRLPRNKKKEEKRQINEVIDDLIREEVSASCGFVHSETCPRR